MPDVPLARAERHLALGATVTTIDSMDIAARPKPRELRIRPVRPADWSALAAFYDALGAEHRRSRFLGYGSVSPELAQWMCAVDHRQAEGMVAVEVRADETERICGHLCMEPSGHGSEELAVAVADDCRHMGLGHRLVLAGLDWAREHEVSQVTATAFATNAPVLHLLADSAPGVTMRTLDDGLVEIDIPVTTH